MIGEVLRFRYELERRLGAGPLFETFAGSDRLRGRAVALKLLKPGLNSRPEVRLALRAYAEAAQKRRWKGTPEVLGVEEHDGRLFLVAEMAQGSPLSERIRRLAPMSVPIVVDTAISIAEILDAAHKNGFVHGSLRPTDVIVSLDGSVTVTDFGIRSVALTNPDAFRALLDEMGPYQAPELFAGGDVSPASDLYALGVVLFEMLTGERPFQARGPEEVAAAPVPSLRLLNPAVPRPLQELVEKAAAKTPSFRYRSAEQLLLDLKAIRDSIRFGRPMSWSISPEPPPAEPAPVMKPAAPAQARKTEPPPKPPQPKPRTERAAPDVPRWLTLINLSLTILVIIVVLAFAGWLFLGLTKPEEVRVPSLIGKTTAEARSLLEERDLKLRVSAQQINEHFPPKTVFEMSPPAGTRVRAGSTVSVGISLGPRMIPMPDLRGMTEVRARNRLIAEGIRSVVVDGEEYDDEVPKGHVARQSPKAGVLVDAGQRVRLYLSRGPGPEPEPGPDGFLQPDETPEDEPPNVWHIPIEVPGDGRAQVYVRVDFTDDAGTKTVYEGMRYPGKEFDLTVRGHGDQATVALWVNGWRSLVMVLTPD